MDNLQKAIIANDYIFEKIGGEYKDVITGQFINLTQEEVLRGVDLYNRGITLRSLRIFNFINSSENPLTTDFTILGLKKTSPTYLRGRKTAALYLSPIDGSVVVEKIFEDVEDENGNLKALQVTFNWLMSDDTIGITKTEIVREYNTTEAITVGRTRRQRQIDFLKAGAAGTVIEVHLAELITHYNDDVDLYVKYGSEDWLNAVNTEADATILTYLAIEVPRVDDPQQLITIKNSLIYQMTGVLYDVV